MDPRAILTRFKTGRPSRFTVSKAPAVVQGVVLDIDEKTGKSRAIRLLTKEDGEVAHKTEKGLFPA
jgi:calcineurin-like phosphoesterase